MLVRLFGSNFRSIKEPFELSLLAADLTRKEDCNRGTIAVPISGMAEPLHLLRTLGIYGPNASGKSSLLVAANALRWLARESSPRSKPDGRIAPYEPFLLDDKTKNAPTELGCDVVFKKSLLRYEIKLTSKVIQAELLTLIDKDGEHRLIERNASGEVKGHLIAESEANRLYVSEMQPNVAVLSKLAQHGPRKGKSSVVPYYNAILNATHHEDYHDAALEMIKLGDSSADDKFADDLQYREWIMHHIIQKADIGIAGVRTRRESFKVPASIRESLMKSGFPGKIPDTRVVVEFLHAGVKSGAINFSEESAGTKKLYNIASQWWAMANREITLFADELSASLHPRLLDRLVRAVNDPPSEKMRSQLIFATHDTGLLESQDGLPPALRRDQVYFTKKSAQGATEVYSLTEFKEDARGVHNIRKRYLSGLYGALPSVEKLSL
ncbi:ATP/GTP-binding protein [Schlesneria sp. DSM 10557]|uniref:AAA family ATPase n=1 Tax=Schlesneria sp. DSM 10557 TaxID=3044399 RepID=UPI0035A12054